jgi:hypothetical protein
MERVFVTAVREWLPKYLTEFGKVLFNHSKRFLCHRSYGRYEIAEKKHYSLLIHNSPSHAYMAHAIIPPLCAWLPPAVGHSGR